jgi:hypothetical protein
LLSLHRFHPGWLLKFASCNVRSLQATSVPTLDAAIGSFWTSALSSVASKLLF